MRCALAGDEHRADHDVGVGHRPGHVRGVRIEPRDIGADGARRDQLVAVHVEHDHFGPEARRDDRRVAAGDTAAEHHDLAALRRRHAAEQDALAALRLVQQVVATCIDSRPAMSLIGASSGSRPWASSTVSKATAVQPISHRLRVSSGSAARCR
jgi:hypothetical protein